MEGPTRITASSQTQQDLIFSNKPERVVKTFNFITGLSDHNLTLMSRKLTKKGFHHSLRPVEQLRIPKNEMADFHRAVQETDWRNIFNGSTEAAGEIFTSMLHSLSSQERSKEREKSMLFPGLIMKSLTL